LFVFIANIFSTSVSYVFKFIADAAAKLPDPRAFDDLLLACIAYILFLAIAKFLWRASGFLGASWAMGALATARHSLTAYVTLHSRSYFSDRFAGSLSNKISHAARGVREVVDQILWQFLELAIVAVVSLIIFHQRLGGRYFPCMDTPGDCGKRVSR
jgi:ABC-type multidrug transport system fused ATPase/permease subunit